MIIKETATMGIIRSHFKRLVDQGLLVSIKVCHEPESESCGVCNGEEDHMRVTVCPFQPLEYIDVKFTLDESVGVI